MKLRSTLLARVFVGVTSGILAAAAHAQNETSSPGTAPSPVLPAGTTTSTSASAGSTGATVATSPVSASSSMPNEAEMMKQMMEMSKLNENHKLLASLDGTW